MLPLARSGLSSDVEAREIVAVPERGHVDLSASVWKRLRTCSEFGRLMERGVLSATLLAEGRVRLVGSCYVGRAFAGDDIVVELREKVPGALESLLRYATYDAFRVEKIGAPASELGELVVLLIRHFLASVTSYASLGRDFRYADRRLTGPVAGGKLDMTRTVQLRARGLGHLLAFSKAAVGHNTAVNRIVLAALREVERLTRIVDIPDDDASRARGLAMLFSDCRDAEMVFGRRDAMVEDAQALLETALRPSVRDMIALAGVVLAHESFEPAELIGRRAPRSWFLNLETLFETAVRRVFANILAPSHDVTSAAEHRRRVFGAVVGEYGAHPDLVISRDLQVEAIGDVKYKNWGDSAPTSDVYQLLVHSAAFDSERAFLVFPHDSFAMRRLGESVTGADVIFFAVDVRDLRRDLGQAAAALGLVQAAA